MFRSSSLALALWCAGCGPSHLAHGIRETAHSALDKIGGAGGASISYPYCCCKEGLCGPGDTSDDGLTPAVYATDARKCCKGSDWSCDSWFWNWGFDFAEHDSYCVDGGQQHDFRYPGGPEGEAHEGSLKPNSPWFAVNNYCDWSGQAQEPADSAEYGSEYAAAETEQRSQFVGEIVRELTKNSLDAMAKDIFSVFVCVRWAPTEEFRRMAESEVRTKHLDPGSDPFDLFSKSKFIPLRCSRNVNVFKSHRKTHTPFAVFEETMNGVASWIHNESHKVVSARLEMLDKLSEESLSSATKLFNAKAVHEAAAACGVDVGGSAGGSVDVDFGSDRTEHILQDCAAVRWWLRKLYNWHRVLPFLSFMAPSDEAVGKAAPQPGQQVLVCFGKRIASELHRRQDGDHLLTDQNMAGCHGFWTLPEAAKMLRRTVQLWRPPTCELARQELDMKVKIMSLLSDMNMKLFEALPAMIADELEGAPDSDLSTLKGTKTGYWGTAADALVKAFSGSKNQYTRLGQLLTNTAVKWAVCPVRSGALADETERLKLDTMIGSEDRVSRYYTKAAYASWTGEQSLLPGLTCKALEAGEDLQRCSYCWIGQMREDMPEPYVDPKTGVKQEFICPVVPLLAAKQQLEVFKKSHGACLMHMTVPQWTAKGWMWRGRTLHRTQYDKMTNPPSAEYETVKILDFRSDKDEEFGQWWNFVEVGRRCTETERAATPRWCAKPEVAGPHWLRNMLRDVGGAAVEGAYAAATGVKMGLEYAGYMNATAPRNGAYEARGRVWLGKLGTKMDSGLFSLVSEALGFASTRRYKRLYDRSFTDLEVGELLHSASFQDSKDDTGGDSKRRDSYERYAVTCPCPDFDPRREFSLKYTWGEHALRLLNTVKYKFGASALRHQGVRVDLQSIAVLYMEDVETAYVDDSVYIRAAPLGGDAAGATHWRETKEPFLSELVGVTHLSATSVSPTSAYGFSAHFACGTRAKMHSLAVPTFDVPSDYITSELLTCIEEGRETNKALKKASPTALFFEDEVVVRVTFVSMSKCQHESSTKDGGASEHRPAAAPGEKRSFREADNGVYKSFSQAGRECSPVDTEGLPPALRREVQGSGTYRGMYIATGLPPDTLTEVLLDPGDVYDELRSTSHSPES